MIKTVFILGAGASISHSKGDFPSYNEFFSKAKTLGLINKRESGKIFKKYEGLKEYILNVIGEDILNEKNKIDIERLMTFIDIEIENSNDQESYKIYRKNIFFLYILLIYPLLQ